MLTDEFTETAGLIVIGQMFGQPGYQLHNLSPSDLRRVEEAAALIRRRHK